MKQSGFTLLELLTVVAIIGLASSLIAPDMLALYESYQVREERGVLKGILKKVSYQNFLSDSSATLKFNQQTLKIVRGETEQSLEYQFIHFIPTEIKLNKKGYLVDPKANLKYKIHNSELELDMSFLKCCQ